MKKKDSLPASVQMTAYIAFASISDHTPDGGDLTQDELISGLYMGQPRTDFLCADDALNRHLKVIDPDAQVTKIIPTTVLLNPLDLHVPELALEREAATILFSKPEGTKLVFENYTDTNGKVWLSETSLVPTTRAVYEWLADARAKERGEQVYGVDTHASLNALALLERKITSQELIKSRKQMCWNLEEGIIRQVIKEIAPFYGIKSKHIAGVILRAKMEWSFEADGINFYHQNSELLLYGKTGEHPMELDEWMERTKVANPNWFEPEITPEMDYSFRGNIVPHNREIKADVEVRVRNNSVNHSVTAYQNSGVSTIATGCTLDQANTIARGHATTLPSVILQTVKASTTIYESKEVKSVKLHDDLFHDIVGLQTGDCILLSLNRGRLTKTCYTVNPAELVNADNDKEIEALRALPYELAAAMRRNATMANDHKLLRLLDKAQVAVDAVDTTG